MGYQRHFIGENAHQEALDAVTEWCNTDQMRALRRLLAMNLRFRDIRISCAFAGFEGYPVKALLREYHPRYVRRFGPKSLQTGIIILEHA